MDISQYIPDLFYLILIIGPLEYFAGHVLWFPLYYSYGIPCFYMKFRVEGNEFNFHLSKFENSFKIPENIFRPIPSILFKKTRKYECAFREELGVRLLYLPIIHGIMVYKPHTKNVIIKWKFNYFPALCLLGLVPLDALQDTGKIDIMSLQIGVTLFIVFFLIQAIRYLLVSFDLKAQLKYYNN